MPLYLSIELLDRFFFFFFFFNLFDPQYENLSRQSCEIASMSNPLVKTINLICTSSVL